MGRYHTRFIGRFSTVKRDMKPDSMRNILPILNQSQYTLCFNWKITRQLQVDITRH